MTVAVQFVVVCRLLAVHRQHGSASAQQSCRDSRRHENRSCMSSAILLSHCLRQVNTVTAGDDVSVGRFPVCRSVCAAA